MCQPVGLLIHFFLFLRSIPDFHKSCQSSLMENLRSQVHIIPCASVILLSLTVNDFGRNPVLLLERHWLQRSPDALVLIKSENISLYLLWTSFPSDSDFQQCFLIYSRWFVCLFVCCWIFTLTSLCVTLNILIYSAWLYLSCFRALSFEQLFCHWQTHSPHIAGMVRIP